MGPTFFLRKTYFLSRKKVGKESFHLAPDRWSGASLFRNHGDKRRVYVVRPYDG